jgi:hypothetical protein
VRINLVGGLIRNYPFATELAFKRGFDRLGTHQVTVVDPSRPGQKWDLGADATVVFKTMDAYWEDLALCGGKKIVYQPDDLRFPHIRQMMVDMRSYCDYAFTFDNDGAQMALDLGYLKAERLLLTADDELYHPLGIEKDIDVCFVGSLSNGVNHRSRVKMCQIVNSLGLKTAFVSDLYNIEELNRIYNRSKIVLNHATDVGQPFGHGFGYQCRHFEAGFAKSYILSNLVDNEQAISNFDVFSDERSLVHQIETALMNDSWRSDTARQLYSELMQFHKPEHRAKQMIDFIEAL